MVEKSTNNGFILKTFISDTVECIACGELVYVRRPWEEKTQKEVLSLKEIHSRECLAITQPKND